MKQIIAFAFVAFALVMCNQSRAEQRAVFVRICRDCPDTTDCRTYFFKRAFEGEGIDTAQCRNIKTFTPATVPPDISELQKDTVVLRIECP